jgi:hypothetical protein
LELCHECFERSKTFFLQIILNKIFNIKKMPEYQIRIVKLNETTSEETNFSWKEIKEVVAEDRYLRITEKFDLHIIDSTGNGEFIHHAIEGYDYGYLKLVCLYDTRDGHFYTFADKYEDDFVKEKVYIIAHLLEATLIGEEGEIYDIQNW